MTRSSSWQIIQCMIGKVLLKTVNWSLIPAIFLSASPTRKNYKGIELWRKKYSCNRRSRFYWSNIVADQLAKGHHVAAVDNLVTGRMENLALSLKNPAFKFYQADLNQWDQIEEIIAWADCIFHMAGSVGQRFVLKILCILFPIISMDVKIF